MHILLVLYVKTMRVVSHDIEKRVRVRDKSERVTFNASKMCPKTVWIRNDATLLKKEVLWEGNKLGWKNVEECEIVRRSSAGDLWVWTLLFLSLSECDIVFPMMVVCLEKFQFCKHRNGPLFRILSYITLFRFDYRVCTRSLNFVKNR